MRRKDREVTSEERINEVISRCHCIRLGFCDEGEVYIVPLNFGFEEKDGRRTFYFHSAKEGRKIDLIKKGQIVGFEMDTNYKLNEGETACDYSARFLSVIGTGRVSILEGQEEKAAALQSVMLHNTGKGDWTFADAMVNAVCVFKLDVDKISCKEHL